MPKVNFIEYLRQGTLGCHYFPACSSGTSEPLYVGTKQIHWVHVAIA